MAEATAVPQPPKKKGFPVIAWIGIGCGVIVIIGLVAALFLGIFAASRAKRFAAEMKANPAKATAEMIVKLNPDLELVASDESAGTITIREKKTGRVATFKYEDLKEGRLSFETEDGKVEFSARPEDGGRLTVTTDEGETRLSASASAENVPAWVPLHPRAADVAGSYTASSAQGQTGAVSFSVPEDSDRVIEYYRSWMEDHGFKVTTSVTSSSAGKTGLVSGQNEKEGRNLNVTFTPEGDGSTRVAVQYSSGGS